MVISCWLLIVGLSLRDFEKKSWQSQNSSKPIDKKFKFWIPDFSGKTLLSILLIHLR